LHGDGGGARFLTAEPDRGDREDQREIDEWLREYLEHEGSAKARDVIHDGKLAGYTVDEIKKARRRIKAATRRHGFGPGSTFFWSIGAIEPIHKPMDSMAPMACRECGAVLETPDSIAAGVCAECRQSANTDPPPTDGGTEKGSK